MIKVTDKYYINADSNCYITGKLGIIKKKGEETPTLLQRSYYDTMAGALKGILSAIMRDKVSEGEVSNLKEYLDELKKEHTRLEQLLSDFEKEEQLDDKT